MTSNKSINVNDYEYLLPDHWIRTGESYWERMHDSYVSYVTKVLKDHCVKNVVEIGCGDGWNCGQVANSNIQVTGFDWSKNGIEHAKRMVPKGTFICCDIRDHKMASMYREKFDAAIFIEVIEHIPPDDCVADVKNIGNLLQKNGLLILTTPSINLKNTNPQHYRHFDQKELQQIVEYGGFEVNHLTGYGDIKQKNTFYWWSRFVNNRYYLIKPLQKMLLKRYHPMADTPLNRCAGLIVTAKKK